MPTMHPSAEPLVPNIIPSQESPLSPEWTHAISTLITSRSGSYTIESINTPCLLSNGIQRGLNVT